MAKTPPDMTPAEFNVMKLLWELGRGSVAEVREAHRRAYDSDLAYTTVMTLLGRLAAKGAVKVDRTRQPFLYRPAFRRESVLRDRLRHFLDTVFDGHADSLVLHLIEDESLSLEELRRIERRLETSDDDPDGDGEDGR
jgi:BlaI family transcriptional regulator, penicillinase repressor